MMMTEVRRITDQLRRAMMGNAWHGPAVREVLRGVTASQAASRPIPAAHSIWELVLHTAAWQNEVAGRLEGGPSRGLPPEANFPAVSDTSLKAWASALEELERSYKRVLAAMEQISDDRLDHPLAGTDTEMWTYYITMHGIVQHDLYHAGQMAILKKAF